MAPQPEWEVLVGETSRRQPSPMNQGARPGAALVLVGFMVSQNLLSPLSCAPETTTLLFIASVGGRGSCVGLGWNLGHRWGMHHRSLFLKLYLLKQKVELELSVSRKLPLG